MIVCIKSSGKALVSSRVFVRGSVIVVPLEHHNTLYCVMILYSAFCYFRIVLIVHISSDQARYAIFIAYLMHRNHKGKQCMIKVMILTNALWKMTCWLLTSFNRYIIQGDIMRQNNIILQYTITDCFLYAIPLYTVHLFEGSLGHFFQPAPFFKHIKCYFWYVIL